MADIPGDNNIDQIRAGCFKLNGILQIACCTKGKDCLGVGKERRGFPRL